MNDLILLAALHDGPKHGWALKKLAGFLTGAGDLHNNLVYPLMKRFVARGWVKRRSEPGERGQRRGVYSLTGRGKQELMRRLGGFGEKEAASESEFRVRVGLFEFLPAAGRTNVLTERDRWLASREQRFSKIRGSLGAMNASEWSHEVVGFLLREIRSERKWIRRLTKRAAQSNEPKKVEGS